MYNSLKKYLSIAILLLFVSTIISPTIAEAKRGYGGGGFKKSSGGSSFFKKSKKSKGFFSKKKRTKSYGGAYNKNKTVTKRVVKKKPNYGGNYNNKVVPTKKKTTYGGSYDNKVATKTTNGYGGGYSSNKKPAPKVDSFQQAKAKKDRKVKNKQALASYKEKQKKLKESAAAKKAPDTKVSASTTKSYRDNLGSSGKDFNSHDSRKANYYDNRNYQPPVYVQNSGGSWGGLDGFFLGYMLAGNNSHGSSYMYNNQNDPAVQAYLADLREQSRDNDDLRERLHKLDKEMAVMKSQGVVPEVGYIPEGIDPDMIYSKEYLKNHKDDLYSKNASIKSNNINTDDEEGSTGLIFLVLILLMGGVAWFVFIRRS